MNTGKIQIGIIGSMLDQTVDPSLKKKARELGKEIAKHGMILLFGYEEDFNSLSQIAAESAEMANGKTIAFIWGKNKVEFDNLKSLQVVTGLQRGGGREFSFILSCDVIISIGGGAGTLTEIAIAYQSKIPIITLKNTGGWSEKIADQYLDDRKTQKIISVEKPDEAVQKALELVSCKFI